MSGPSLSRVMSRVVNGKKMALRMFYGFCECELPAWIIEKADGEFVACFKTLREVKEFLKDKGDEFVVYKVQSAYIWEEVSK